MSDTLTLTDGVTHAEAMARAMTAAACPWVWLSAGGECIHADAFIDRAAKRAWCADCGADLT